MMTDPIADMLTRIRNAQLAHKAIAEIPTSKMKAAIANILTAEGYLEKVEEKDDNPKQLILYFKYIDRQPAIRHIKRESKPGHRLYYSAKELPKVLNDYGIAILSTSQGIMTNKKARKLGIGGEAICSVY